MNNPHRKIGSDGLTKDQRYYRKNAERLKSKNSTRICTSIAVQTASVTTDDEPNLASKQHKEMGIQVEAGCNELEVYIFDKPERVDIGIQVNAASAPTYIFGSGPFTSVCDPELWLGDHVPNDLWCRGITENLVALRGDIYKLRPEFSSVSPASRLLRSDGKVTLKSLDYLYKLRRAVIKWSSSYGGVVHWDDTLDLLRDNAVRAGEAAVIKFVKELLAKIVTGRRLVNDIKGWALRDIPGERVAVYMVFMEMSELLNAVLGGLHRLEARFTLLKKNAYTFREGLLEEILLVKILSDKGPELEALDEEWIQSYLTASDSEVDVDSDVAME